MSQKHVREIITEFIDSQTPEVLAVSGPWGIGKTFAIKSIISQYAGTNSLAKYAYASAFGAQSLAAIKSTLVTSQRTLPFKTDAPKTKREKFSMLFGSREWINQFRENNNFGIKHVVVATEMLVATMARDMLVVIDDLERLGKGISMQDLMGLVSELKEQNNCKIILILNSDKLGNHSQEYEHYQEKVIDQKLDFSLIPSEAAELGLSKSTPLRDIAIDNINKLEISNIRVIKKIERALKMLFPIVEQRSHLLHYQLATSVCVFAAALYERGRGFAPPEQILKYNRFARVGNILAGRGASEPDPAWVTLLERCNFHSADEFDHGVCLAMERGYIVDTELESSAAQLDAAAHNQRLNEIFQSAWDLFHNRLDVTASQLTSALMNAVRQSAIVISTGNMNATARLLRQLGSNEEANSAIEEWIIQNRPTPSVFDLQYAETFGEIDDPFLRERCISEFNINHQPLPLQQAIDILVENKHWNDSIPAALAAASREDLVALIKANQGPNLNLVVNAIAQVRGDAQERLAIGRTLKEALTTIAQESSVTRLRVKRWGIDLDDLGAPVPAD